MHSLPPHSCVALCPPCKAAVCQVQLQALAKKSLKGYSCISNVPAALTHYPFFILQLLTRNYDKNTEPTMSQTLCLKFCCFPTLEKMLFLGERVRHPMHPTVYSPLIIRTICCSDALSVVCASLCCQGLTTVSSLLSVAGPWST